jgi:hypothetical protein
MTTAATVAAVVMAHPNSRIAGAPGSWFSTSVPIFQQRWRAELRQGHRNLTTFLRGRHIPIHRAPRYRRE